METSLAKIFKAEYMKWKPLVFLTDDFQNKDRQFERYNNNKNNEGSFFSISLFRIE